MNDYLLDLIVIPILLIVSIVAFTRGLIKELSSFLTWLAAILASYFLSPYLTVYISKSVSSEALAEVISGSILFIVVMIIVGVLLSKLSSKLTEKIPEPVNQSLGLVFGFAKYYLICSLIFGVGITLYAGYLVSSSEYNKLVKKNKRIGPSWVINSYSYPFMKFGSDLLSPVTKFLLKDVQNGVLMNIKPADGELPNIVDDVKKDDKINNIKPKEELQKGYPTKEIEKMNRLIDIIVE